MDLKESNPVDLKPGVSVVVCCYNSSAVIEGTIKALSKQIVPKNIGYEVILVDNNCTDNTVELARTAWQNKKYRFRIVKEGTPGLIHARKAGVLNAKFSFLLFVDDDNILMGDWIRKLFFLYKRMPNVGAIGGYNEATIQGEKPQWFDQFRSVYACGPRDEVSGPNPKKIFGAGLSFRTNLIYSILFSQLPPFLVGRTHDALIRGEDTEMSLRCRLMGWDIYYDSSLRLKHIIQSNRLSWEYVCRARKGGGIASIILKIYRRVLARENPKSYSQNVFSVLKYWKGYFKENLTCFFQIKKEGSIGSFYFYRALGMSLGLLAYRKTYSEIQNKIIDYYKKKMINIIYFKRKL